MPSIVNRESFFSNGGNVIVNNENHIFGILGSNAYEVILPVNHDPYAVLLAILMASENPLTKETAWQMYKHLDELASSSPANVAIPHI